MHKLGPKKHKRCEEIGGRSYTTCMTKGMQHGWAKCYYTLTYPSAYDHVNYRTGECIRDAGKNAARLAIERERWQEMARERVQKALYGLRAAGYRVKGLPADED